MNNNPTYQEFELKVKELEKQLSESKQNEEKLKIAKEEAERTSNAKSRFIVSLSHELRTPLNSIIGFGHLLESEFNKQQSELRKESLELILKSGHYMLNLVNDISDLSLIESGKLKLSVRNIDIKSIIEEVHSLIKPIAEDRCIVLRNPVFECGDCQVRVDPVRLKQVLFNLLSNAVKCTLAGDSIELHCKEEIEGFLRINVIDTGPGVPERRQENLFEPFYQTSKKVTGEEEVNLGLAISKHLVESMGGNMGLESLFGRGTCFYVDLVKVQDQQVLMKNYSRSKQAS